MIVLLVVLMISGTVFGQANQGPMMKIPGLTDEQKTAIQKLRLANQKEMQGLKNQLAENRAHYHTLMTADKPDMNAINKNIDEYSAIRTTMMKSQAAHIQDVRKLLTDEQRLVFDSHRGMRGRASHNSYGNTRELPGFGNRRGMGYAHTEQGKE